MEQTMNSVDFRFTGEQLTAMASGALWWADQFLLVVSDLHLGKSERIARLGGAMLPPFDTKDTLTRLDADLLAKSPNTVICLGDSFDDLTAADKLSEDTLLWLTRMQAGREWIWVEGNHDAGPIDLAGTHMAVVMRGALTFKHIASHDSSAEISGHFHPKATISSRGRAITRRCFVYDDKRIIMPAYGTYTGGLRTTNPAISTLMGPEAKAILIGTCPQTIPMPRPEKTEPRRLA
jgi:DNA ligase-associated metallophosphoesterase